MIAQCVQRAYLAFITKYIISVYSKIFFLHSVMFNIASLSKLDGFMVISHTERCVV